MSAADFVLEGRAGDTVRLLRPLNDDAKEWLNNSIPPEPDSQWLGNAVAVEHRYVLDIVKGIEADGMVVS